MALTQSTEAAARATLGTLGDTRGGKTVPQLVPFNITIPASPGSGPTVTLFTAPVGFKPRLVFFATDGLSASGGVGLSCEIGDADDTNRLLEAVDSDAATSAIGLAAAGFDYEYTAETDIILTMTSGKTPTQGQKVSGFVLANVRQAS